MTRSQGSVLALMGLLLLLFWLVPEVPLLGFAAVLLALALHAGADPLARRTGLSVSLLSQIERAESSASISSLYRIASALRVRMSELFADV